MSDKDWLDFLTFVGTMSIAVVAFWAAAMLLDYADRVITRWVRRWIDWWQGPREMSVEDRFYEWLRAERVAFDIEMAFRSNAREYSRELHRCLLARRRQEKVDWKREGF